MTEPTQLNISNDLTHDQVISNIIANSTDLDAAIIDIVEYMKNNDLVLTENGEVVQ